ncbi:L,D-transpeptidase family protein [Rhizosphaericola mali]|nr:L,D-transpeptidase family protein [Rhizosphaericola mali]
MNKIVALVFSFVFIYGANAQTLIADGQGTSTGMTNRLKTLETKMRKDFDSLGIQWPIKEVYFRSFKYDGQLEVWVRDSDTMPFKLYKTYKVCAMAGSMGPKRVEGDFQVPEGFYYISEFNPRSEYHLSLKLNYPNESDRVLSDQVSPGGRIYIHGSCVTVGCIPLRDEQIEEVYLIAASARRYGQNYIPVHIFPVRFNNKKSLQYLYKSSKEDLELQRFEVGIKEAYDYFNENKKIPLIGINQKGDYMVLN